MKLHHLASPRISWMMAAVMAYPLRLGEGYFFEL